MMRPAYPMILAVAATAAAVFVSAARPVSGRPAAEPAAHTAMLGRMEVIAREVARVRKWKPRAVRRRVVSADEMSRLVRAARERVVPPGQRARWALLWSALGLAAGSGERAAGVSEGPGGERAISAEAADEALAFYDPSSDALTATLRASDAAIAYEAARAARAARLDVYAFVAAGDTLDGTLARVAVLEGEAAAIAIERAAVASGGDVPWTADVAVGEIAAALTRGDATGPPRPPAAHAAGARRLSAVRTIRAFPRAAGLSFVMAARRHQPWRAVDALYRRPPASTEHILHPDAYARDERPRLVRSAPLPAAAGAAVAADEVMGEAVYASWIAEHLAAAGVEAAVARERAERAAAGWGGDRASVYVDGRDGAVLAVLASVWDSDADAFEYVEALADALPAQLGAADTDGAAASGVRSSVVGSRGAAALERRGDRVVVVIAGASDREGAPAGQAGRAQAALEQVWKAWRFGAGAAR